MEIQETQFEHERHQILEFSLTWDLLRLQALVLATFGQPVVASVELEGRKCILHHVLVHLNPCLQVVQLVVTRVPLEYLCGNAFVRCQEPQLNVLAIQL